MLAVLAEALPRACHEVSSILAKPQASGDGEAEPEWPDARQGEAGGEPPNSRGDAKRAGQGNAPPSKR
jgi:hypothetical protein